MLPEPKISYKPFWGICRPLNSWRANSPNPIQIYCAKTSHPMHRIELHRLNKLRLNHFVELAHNNSHFASLSKYLYELDPYILPLNLISKNH